MDEITAAYNRITGQDGDWNPDVTLDALKDLARAVAANAWDEGAEAFGNRSRMNTPHGEWPPTNPYREEQK